MNLEPLEPLESLIELSEEFAKQDGPIVGVEWEKAGISFVGDEFCVEGAPPARKGTPWGPGYHSNRYYWPNLKGAVFKIGRTAA